MYGLYGSSQFITFHLSRFTQNGFNVSSIVLTKLLRTKYVYRNIRDTTVYRENFDLVLFSPSDPRSSLKRG